MSRVSKEQQVLGLMREMPLLHHLAEAELEDLIKLGQTILVERHETIYQKSAPSDQLFFLLQGAVKIGSFGEEGREIIKRVLYAPNLFGEMGLVGEVERQDTATNLNETSQLIKIPIPEFRQYMNQHPSLAMGVIDWIGSRLRKMEIRLESMIFKDARERIIDFLRDSAATQGKKVGFELLIKHNLTQQDIANFTGTSRQTVTSVLNELKKSNLIYFNRRSILIRDLSKLG